MNNLFQVFSIEVPGQLLDDKRFYEYSDFDGEDYTSPTDAEVLAKAEAFVRMQQFKRMLAQCTVPLYCTVEFETPGTASTVPTNAKITVGYLSIEPFISTLDPIPVFADETEAQTAAAAALKAIMDATLAQDISQEYAVLQKLYTMENNPIAKISHPYREIYMEYIDVAAPTPAVVSTVTYIKL
jgi:hypothetical protein